MDANIVLQVHSFVAGNHGKVQKTLFNGLKRHDVRSGEELQKFAGQAQILCYARGVNDDL